ncbi:MAG: DUF3800 domain-containing protein [Lachnospiraceae bacterium]|nr:DUF3800 domain-containing protein [Lachnospiraceae bacterium]
MDSIEKGNNIYIYVDESGSITKTNISNNRYFVIAMLFTDDPEAVRRLYKKKISQLMRKNDKYKDLILKNHEIKGSDVSESTKMPIYEHIIKHAFDKIELGIIVLDNQYTTDKFIENHARSFNYMIQTYLDSCFRKHSRFMHGSGKMEFIIDEQNVATGAKYDLSGYLNQQLTFKNPICDRFEVAYTDSKNEKLVQLADYIANTFYRNIEKKIKESRDTVNIWLPTLCNHDVFDFSEGHDIALNLPQEKFTI